MVSNVIVQANYPNGFATGTVVGTVSNGVTYSYSASGLCAYCDYDPEACTENASGVNTETGLPVACPPVCGLVCPGLQCFSLVGRIEPQ